MKNLSELMVDLAYSALFLKDKEISGHVKDLFNQIKDLQDETLKLVFRVKISDDERIGIIDLLEYIKDYTNAAVNISELTKNGLPNIIQELLTETDERVISTRITDESFLNKRTIGEAKIKTLTGLNIISVKRENKWLFNINKSFELKSGDVVIGVGTLASNELFKKLIKGKIDAYHE